MAASAFVRCAMLCLKMWQIWRCSLSTSWFLRHGSFGWQVVLQFAERWDNKLYMYIYIYTHVYTYIYIYIDEVRLDPHQAFPHYQFFSLLFPFFYSTSSLIYLFSSPPLALPSGLRSFAFGSDWMPKFGWAALVWAGLRKQLQFSSNWNICTCYEYETIGKMLWGYAPSALPLEISDRWFHPLSFLISSSCFCWLVKTCRANLVMVGTQSCRTSHNGVGVTSSSFQIQNIACSWNWTRLICRASASTAPSWFRGNSRIRWGQVTAAAAQMINFSIPCGKNLERQFWKFIVRQLVNWT